MVGAIGGCLAQVDIRPQIKLQGVVSWACIEGASTHRVPAPLALARVKRQESDYCTTFSGNNAIVMITL